MIKQPLAMAFQVSRTDTGQFVLTDPRTDTVVVDDDLAAGFEALDRSVTRLRSERGAEPAEARAVASPRLGIVLAIVLPFAWLAVFYFALSHLLAEYTVDRASERETRDRVDELEREVQALRSELAGAPRAAKTQPNVRKPKPKPEAAPEPASEPDPSPEPSR